MNSNLPRLLALSTLAGSALAAAPTSFPDVPRDHWARPAVQETVEAGILEGYGGRFHGTELVNRYQMAVILRRLLAVEESLRNQVEAPDSIAGTAIGPRDEHLARLLSELRAEVYRLSLGLRVVEERPHSGAPGGTGDSQALASLVKLHRVSPRKPW